MKPPGWPGHSYCRRHDRWEWQERACRDLDVVGLWASAVVFFACLAGLFGWWGRWWPEWTFALAGTVFGGLAFVRAFLRIL